MSNTTIEGSPEFRIPIGVLLASGAPKEFPVLNTLIRVDGLQLEKLAQKSLYPELVDRTSAPVPNHVLQTLEESAVKAYTSNLLTATDDCEIDSLPHINQIRQIAAENRIKAALERKALEERRWHAATEVISNTPSLWPLVNRCLDLIESTADWYYSMDLRKRLSKVG